MRRRPFRLHDHRVPEGAHAPIRIGKRHDLVVGDADGMEAGDDGEEVPRRGVRLALLQRGLPQVRGNRHPGDAVGIDAVGFCEGREQHPARLALRVPDALADEVLRLGDVVLLQRHHRGRRPVADDQRGDELFVGMGAVVADQRVEIRHPDVVGARSDLADGVAGAEAAVDLHVEAGLREAAAIGGDGPDRLRAFEGPVHDELDRRALGCATGRRRRRQPDSNKTKPTIAHRCPLK